MTNSYLKLKTGNCKMCNDGKDVPLIKGLCNTHYWFDRRMAFMNKQAKKEPHNEEGLPDLISELDTLVSKYVRCKYADKNGMVKCFTCPTVKPIGEMQAGHFVSRKVMFLRFDTERNIRCQCNFCNCIKHGNIPQFAKALELENPGITEILIEESNTIYKYNRTELKNLIAHYTKLLKQLQK